jgi:hypothetical protein
MEEIDIIELLKRVKEGKEPNNILIGTKVYEIFDRNDLEYMYFYKDNNEGNVYWFEENTIRFDTKIKILDKTDKTIIEELEPLDADVVDCIEKINEIIKYLKEKE